VVHDAQKFWVSGLCSSSGIFWVVTPATSELLGVTTQKTVAVGTPNPTWRMFFVSSGVSGLRTFLLLLSPPEWLSAEY
jgi:hypothetical protein